MHCVSHSQPQGWGLLPAGAVASEKRLIAVCLKDPAGKTQGRQRAGRWLMSARWARSCGNQNK